MVFVSHVAVPPLPPGRNKSDYQRILNNKDRSRLSLKPYVSLRDTLQASISHNAKVGVYRTKPSRDTAAQHVLKNTSEYIYIGDGEDEDYTPSNLRKGAKKLCPRVGTIPSAPQFRPRSRTKQFGSVSICSLCPGRMYFKAPSSVSASPLYWLPSLFRRSAEYKRDKKVKMQAGKRTDTSPSGTKLQRTYCLHRISSAVT